jgi:dTDP-4-amino-4,6-dideoxygalactose transaminase
MIPHNRLTFGEAECDAVLRTVRSGQWAHGPRVEELEMTLARMGGVRQAVCVGSGFAAVRLTLGALGVRSGDSVVVPAYSCVALANAALSWGASVDPVDVDPLYWNLDLEHCRPPAESSRPRAIIAVNTFGAPASFENFSDSSQTVIEDCAHAFGINVDGKPLGSRAQAGVLSFYATKLIGGGEGGAVLTDSDEIAHSVKSARDYADQSAEGNRMNDKMNDLEASLVLAQLQRLSEMIAAREAVAERYLQQLAGPRFESVFRLPRKTGARVWYRFPVEMLTVSAEKVVTGLRSFDIQAAMPVSDWRPKGGRAAPVADRAYQRLVSLPLYPTLTPQEQDAVVKAFLTLCEDYVRA